MIFCVYNHRYENLLVLISFKFDNKVTWRAGKYFFVCLAPQLCTLPILWWLPMHSAHQSFTYYLIKRKLLNEVWHQPQRQVSHYIQNSPSLINWGIVLSPNIYSLTYQQDCSYTYPRRRVLPRAYKTPIYVVCWNWDLPWEWEESIPRSCAQGKTVS